MQEKLNTIRKLRGYSQKEMAKIVAMEQTTYSRKERGMSFITNEEWERFAKALEVSIEEIKEVPQNSFRNENCTFSENSVGIQYVNLPQNVLDVILKYNTKLEEENAELKKKLGE
jgi:transcriptional regulator with XRE-family HTH domain